MARYRFLLNIFYWNLFLVFIKISKTEDDNIFMVGSSKFFVHADVNSYFGYSIASYVGQNKAFCLVGAPRESVEDDVKEKTVNTGAVFSISIDTDDCSRVPMASVDSFASSSGKSSSGDSHWLGGSVAAAVNGIDGVQLGCDPRFLSKTSYGVNSTEQQLIGIGQCSLYTGASLDYITVQPCSSIDEGACLSGFSSSVLVDDQGVIKVALGQPGSFLTEGNVFLGSYKGKTVLDKVQLKTSPMDLKNRGFNLGYAIQMTKLWHKKDLKSPFQNVLSNDVVVTSSTHWKSNDYRGVVLVLDSKLDMGQIVYINDMTGHLGSNFGACIATGDFNGDGILDVAVGAPFYTESWTTSKRMVDIGAVYLFYGQVSTNYKYAVSETKDILKGTQARGNFGQSLTTLGDIDGDGQDDFAVGCPNCGEDSTGSVYIYFGGHLKPVEIIRPRDLNHVPVVPICNNFDDKSIMRPFQNFGWSLTGRFDLDRNSVPDIIIGDYSSSQVVYLQSKNIVWLENSRWLLPTTKSIEWTDTLKHNFPCSGDMCRYYISLKTDVSGRRIHTKSRLTFRVYVDLDSEIRSDRFKRIQFMSTGRSVITRDIDFNLSNSTIELFSAVIEPRFEQIKRNIWQPLIINVSVTDSFRPISDEKTLKVTPWMLHPIKGSKYFLSPVKMFKNPDCGNDNECVADIRVFITNWSQYNTQSTDIFYQEKFQERRIAIGIGNWGENAFNVKLKITIPSVLEFQGLTGLNCSLGMSKDTANVIATCYFGNPFLNSQNNVQKLYLTLNTDGAFRAQKKKGISVDDPMVLTIKAEGSCENKDIDLNNNIGSLDYFLRLSGNVKINPKNLETTSIDSRNFSTKVSEFQKVYPETLGPSYKSVFIITNIGPSPLESIDFTISVPFKTENGENILYFLRRLNQQDSLGNPMTITQLPEVISVKGPVLGKCRIPKRAIDPYNLNAIERNPSRIKRSSENEKSSVKPSSQLSKIKLSRRVNEVVSCNNSKSVFGKVECLDIQCKVFNLTLQSEVQIVILARIWAETFFQYKVSDSMILTTIVGTINPMSYGFRVSGDLGTVTVNISHNIIFKGIEDLIVGYLPVWPIVLGVLLGLLVLTVIIILLWKCGFFQRHRQYKAEIIEDNNGFNNGYSMRFSNNSYNAAHL